jgi:hypothetical protein
MPSYTDSGLRAIDALPLVDVACDHPKWHTLNKAIGCIHPDHGGFPFATVDHHSGARLVDGVPTRYVPA